MGRIKNEDLYILDQTPSGNDRIIGSDGDDLKKTKNFSIDDILTYFQNNNPTNYTLPTATTTILGGIKIDGTTITINGSGVISGINPTGLEKIGGGWRLIGRTSSNYAGLGTQAIDLSYNDQWTNIGATGYGSFAQGEDIKARNFGSIGMGALIDNNDICGFSTGINHVTAGYVNTVFGVGQRITGMGCMAVGQAAEIVSSGTNDWNVYPTKTMFVVGNGTVQNNNTSFTVLTRKNAFKVLYNGEVTAPSLTTALINAEATGRVLTTKEWITAQNFAVGTIPQVAEGTFTPTLNAATGNNYTVSSSWGSYYRIGNMVTVNLGANGITDGASVTGRFRITGLPYSASGVNSGSCVSSIITARGASIDFYLYTIYLSGTEVNFSQNGTSGTTNPSSVTWTGTVTEKALDISFTYFTTDAF